VLQQLYGVSRGVEKIRDSISVVLNHSSCTSDSPEYLTPEDVLQPLSLFKKMVVIFGSVWGGFFLGEITGSPDLP